jgi:ABC-type sulfate transport system permease component
VSAPSPLPPLPAELTLEEGQAPSRRRREGVLSTFVALVASLFLLFVVAPLIGLVGGGGASGVRLLASDAELRSSLLLTVFTATLATVLGIVGATPGG